jgi:hypothetical protein
MFIFHGTEKCTVSVLFLRRAAIVTPLSPSGESVIIHRVNGYVSFMRLLRPSYLLLQ